MKAFLLAAGKGTRLQPLTFETPKCLVPVCSKPLIEYWFDLFELYGINDVLINTSYLADKVEQYLSNTSRNFSVSTVYENTLLGSGGTIKKNWDFVKHEEIFFIFYADNLTDINLQDMLNFHNSHDSDFTLALFGVSNPSECGIVSMNQAGIITSFVEKPENPQSDLAFAGIMIGSPALASFFPNKEEIFDLGNDVLPSITGNASGYIIEDYLLDIGAPEKLAQAENDIKNGKIKIRAN